MKNLLKNQWHQVKRSKVTSLQLAHECLRGNIGHLPNTNNKTKTPRLKTERERFE